VRLAVNARMYSVSPSAKADWKALMAWVVRRAGLDWLSLDHDSPAPLSTLWERKDLGMVMMCGLPYALSQPQPRLIAAPIPSPARYGGRPVYFSDFVVLADAPCKTLEDTFGGVLGYTLPGSMSGGIAPYHHLMELGRARGHRLYTGVVGDLINGRGVIDAVVSGRADVGTLDSYYLDLLRQHEPAYAAQVRVVDSTRAHPIPPLVATAALSEAQTSQLRGALIDTATEPALAPLMQRLMLKGFSVVESHDYDHLADMARAQTEPFDRL